ncbi:21914_t:CDS:2 [Entrophospora sp. SA101]|nr:21914_t:CDS:2 [Entrophospora sp. SA101]
MDELLQSRPLGDSSNHDLKGQRQANQELHDEIDQLAQSNRDYERRTYNLERDIVLREERIRYLEEELANTIELSIQEREELEKETPDLKKIVYHLKKEIEQKDKELITRENQLAEFDVREKKLKTRIREISKSAGNTPKAYNQTAKLIDENERLKCEIDTLKYNLKDRDNKLAQKKTRIIDLHCQNFALALLRYRDRVELINTQETLQNAQIWNIENEYEIDENSQDSYTSDPDMTTIIELADTIDNYLDTPGTNRTILSNQIKRVTRQIRRKYNNLQTDLINEQQRRYNAEAERDLRQTELRNTEADLNLMTIAYNGEVKERRRWYYSYKDKHRHVINLQRDKFTIHLLLQRYKRQLNACRTENGLLEYNRQMPPDDYVNTLEQAWSIAVPQMTALETANAGDFDDAIKCNVLKSKIGGNVYQQSSYNSKIIEAPVISQSPDIQKMINEALEKQKSDSDAVIEKLRKEVQSQKAQKTQAPVEPVRQPRGPPSNLKTEKDYENYYLAKYYNDLGIYDLDSNYPEKPFQRTNQSARMDRIESKVDEIGQMTSQFGKMVLENQSKKPIAKSNRTQRYYPFQPINYNFSANNENSGYNEENDICNSANPSSDLVTIHPETYDQLLSNLSPAMRKMCQSQTVQKKESKSDEWFSSLQYLNASINDLTISESFLDNGSEFGALNDATINALGWKADKPSDFDIKGNSKHITESLGWFMDVPVSIKDKDGKTVTATGNFTRIDNGEPEPMLCLGMTWIRKVQGILDPNKNQFRMKLHGRLKKKCDEFEKRLIKTEEWLDMALKAGKVLAERCSKLTEAKMGT